MVRWRSAMLAVGCGMALAACLGMAAVAQSTKPPQQPLYLPDPTPRPRDPHSQFGDDPAGLARQQQAAALQRQQQRTLVVAEANEIVRLAQQLRDGMAHSGNEPPGSLDMMTAQKIEKLAKSVKEQMKLQ